MPGPDPKGLHIEEHEDGSWTVTAEIWQESNRRARIARLQAVARNMKRNRWVCERCRAPVPTFRRADARYCREGCRKRAARERRGGC